VSSRIEPDRGWSHVDRVDRKFSARPYVQRREATSIGCVQGKIGRPGAEADRFAACHGEISSERQLTHDGARSSLERSRVACAAQPGPSEREYRT